MSCSTRAFIRLPRLCTITGLSRSSIYLRLGSGKYSDPEFPRPVSLSPTGKGAVAWDLDEVVSWMEKRLGRRGSSPDPILGPTAAEG
ncbi:helix-turn-helix transcriptional regulator [Zoogloea dura]|uniref:AlpA family phage regulatory protein n=1 Tax=Zoogloea dura TaxID=2728840 RepID=A0A848FWX1_9RHOO|nr:AlpA family phage regulatory protein [Zoogloea dura]NML24427.1 AlpA family phage regulatory protein [Zoogloea dura]